MDKNEQSCKNGCMRYAGMRFVKNIFQACKAALLKIDPQKFLPRSGIFGASATKESQEFNLQQRGYEALWKRAYGLTLNTEYCKTIPEVRRALAFSCIRRIEE